MPELAWAELSTAEILAAVHHLAEGSDGSASSGWLDVHQWAGLQSVDEISVVGPHSEAQFRRAGLNCVPAQRIARVDLTKAPPQQRNARALRRNLEQTCGHLGGVGDVLVLGEVAWVALTGELELPAGATEPQSDVIHQWPTQHPASQSASCASLRLDALVSRIFNVSRAESQVAITHGFVWLNFRESLKPAANAAVGSNVVFRGKGRAKLLAAVPNLRSGRVMLTYELWPV